MAKKKSVAKTAAPIDSQLTDAISRPSTGEIGQRQIAPLPPDAAVSLAWPVASIVNLETLFVDELHAKRTPEGYRPEDPMSISLDTGEMGLGRDELKNRLFIKLGLSMKAAKAEAPADSEPSVQIKCSFVLVYSLRSFDGISDEQLAAFAQTSCVFNVWPYWRQIVHTSSLQLGIPAIILPTYRVNESSTPSQT